MLALHPAYLVALDSLGDDEEKLQAGGAQPLPHT